MLSIVRGNFVEGVAPDLFTLHVDDTPSFLEFLTPITNITDHETGLPVRDSEILTNYSRDFVDLVVRETTNKDKIYGITNEVDTLQLYYNENLLSQAGIVNPPVTWSELDLQLNDINRQNQNDLEFDKSAISLGTGFSVRNGDLDLDANINHFYEILPTLIFQAGGQLYDFQSDTAVFGAGKNQLDLETDNITSETFETIEFGAENPTANALIFYLSFANSAIDRYSWSTESLDIETRFLLGDLAYILNYNDFQDTIAEGNRRLDYKVAEIPQLDLDNKKTYGTFFVDVINRQVQIAAENAVPGSFDELEKNTKLQKARQFLHYLSTLEAQEKILANTGRPAARRDLIERQTQSDLTSRIFAEGSLYADSYYKPDTERVKRLWGDLVYRIQYENQTVDESLARAISEYNIIVGRGPEVRI